MDQRPLLGVCVLVVDDHDDTRELLLLVLSNAGALARAVGTAHDAIRLADTILPDAVVLDIGLPDENGYWLVRELRRRRAPRRLPAVALTAYASAGERVRALREGFDGYLVKPVDPSDVVALIAKVMQAPE